MHVILAQSDLLIITIKDYVGAILGLVRDRSDWRLDPLMVRLYLIETLVVNPGTSQTMRDSDHSFVPVGQGNVVSIEFNLLYRWHATLSAHDTAWTTKMFEGLLKGQNPEKVKTYPPLSRNNLQCWLDYCEPI